MDNDEKTMNTALEELEIRHIDGYTLSLYSFEEMKAIAGDIIIDKFKPTNAKSIDAKRMTEPGGINDIRMGTINLTDTCVTCTGINCQGHWGLIKFGEHNEILLPLYVRRILMILNCMCHDCSRLLFANELDNPELQTAKLTEILKKSPETRLALLEKYCISDIKKCSMKYDQKLNIKPCKSQPVLKYTDVNESGIIKYVKDNDTKKGANKNKTNKTNKDENEEENKDKIFYINKIINILKNISDEDAKVLGFIGRTKPLDLIMQGIFVMPSASRTPSANKKGELIQNPITEMYIEILKAINNKQGASGKIFKAVKNLLIKNETKTGASQSPKAILEYIHGKDGIYRAFMLGKRGDFCGRTVAGPGHSLALNEISIPDYWNKILTDQIKVTSFNHDFLEEELRNGNIVYVIGEKGSQKPASEFQSLLIGQRVELELKKHELIAIGRQPSLSKNSMMAGRVVFNPHKTINPNIGITPAFNLDHDGDELNVWKPRSFVVKAEYKYIMNISECIISTEGGNPLMGLVMNSRTSAHAISKPGVFIEEDVYNDMLQILENKDYIGDLEERARKYGVEPYIVKTYKRLKNKNNIEEVEDDEKIDNEKYDYYIDEQENTTKIIKNNKDNTFIEVDNDEKRNDEKRNDQEYEYYNKKYYKGNIAFSALLPPGFNYNYKGLVIYDGILLKGIIKSGHVSGARSIINDLAIFYSYKHASDFLSDAPHLLAIWFATIGYTVGIRDCSNMVTDSKCEVYNKKFNKRARLFDVELIQLKNIVFKKKLYENRFDIVDLVIPIVNKTTEGSINKEFNNIIQEQVDTLNVIINVYEPSKKKCANFDTYKAQFVQLYKQFAVEKNKFKTTINILYKSVEALFKKNVIVSDNTYILLKAISNDIENSFILIGEAKDMSVLFEKIVVNNENSKDIISELKYDIKNANDNYVNMVDKFITDVIKVANKMNHCALTGVNLTTIENIIMGIFNEALLLLYSFMFINLKNELSKEYNKNVLLKNEKLSQIHLDMEGLGDKKELNAAEAAHHERLVMEKIDVVKVLGTDIAKEIKNNSIINLTDEGSGTKGKMLNIGQIMGSVGQQYVGGKRLWSNYERLSSHFNFGDESVEARGLIESSFNEGVQPTELFFMQGASRDNIIDTAMLIPLVGKLQRLLARSLENVIVAGDGSLRNTNGFMYCTTYNCGFNIAMTLKVPTLEYPDPGINNFIDLAKVIDDENKKLGWFTANEIAATGIKGNKKSLEERFAMMRKKHTNKEEIKIKQPVYNKDYKLTVYEKARIIGVRAEMLNNNDPVRLTKLEMGDMVDALQIAEKEYFLGYLAREPALVIQRRLPGKKEITNIYPTLDMVK